MGGSLVNRAVALAAASFVVVGSLGGLLVSAGPVAAVSLISTMEGADGTEITTDAPRVIFRQYLALSMTFRASVDFTEDAQSATEYGSYALWWRCAGINSGSSVAARLVSPRGHAVVTVTLDGWDGSLPGGICDLVMQVNARTTVNRVTVQMYSGVTGSSNQVLLPTASAGPVPSLGDCWVPMPSGFEGPPAPTDCIGATPTPSASPGPACVVSLTHFDIDWGGRRLLCTPPVGEVVAGAARTIVVHYSVTVDVGTGNGGSWMFTFGGASGGPAWGSENIGGGTFVGDASFNVGEGYGGSLSAVMITDQGGGGNGSTTWNGGTLDDPLASPAPSPSASPGLGECFWPLPGGYQGPLAPRVCGAGEPPGTVSLGECFWRMTPGLLGPAAPRVCMGDEEPGSVGDGSGWADGVPGVDCDPVYVWNSLLPVCGSEGTGLYGQTPAGGYVQPACSSPGPGNLNPLDYFAWIGCEIVGIPGKLLGDFSHLGPAVEAVRTDVGARVPFCWLGEISSMMGTLLDPGSASGAAVTLALDLPVPVVGSAGGHASVSTNTRHVAIPDVSDQMSGARTALGLFYQALGVLFGFRMVNGWFTRGNS